MMKMTFHLPFKVALLCGKDNIAAWLRTTTLKVYCLAHLSRLNDMTLSSR